MQELRDLRERARGLEATSTATTGELERLKKSEAERKKELTRLNKQVQELLAAKSELEQRVRGLEESLAKATSAHKQSLSALTCECERLQEELSRTKTTTVRRPFFLHYMLSLFACAVYGVVIALNRPCVAGGSVCEARRRECDG